MNDTGSADGRARTTRRLALAGLGAATALAATGGTSLAQSLAHLHFLIPAAAGGGWDRTARTVAEAMTRAQLIERATLEHVSGGGGARAIDYLVKTGESQSSTLMVSSTPIVLRAVRGARPSYRELAPIAALVGDYAAIVVRADSPYRDFAALAARVRSNPGGIRVGGGSIRGGMDHLLAARALQAASGIDPKSLVYFPFDAGGDALAALRAGQVHVLSTGLGEVLDPADAEGIRVLAVTAPERLPEAPDLPTLRELGHDVTFVNWRGFFGPPQLSTASADAHARLLGRLLETPEWEAARARHAWRTLYRPRQSFARFLAAEEAKAEEMLTALDLV